MYQMYLTQHKPHLGIYRKSRVYLTLNISASFTIQPLLSTALSLRQLLLLACWPTHCVLFFFPLRPHHYTGSPVLPAMPEDCQSPQQPYQLWPLLPSRMAHNPAPVSLLACSPCFISPGVSELWSLQEGFSNHSSCRLVWRARGQALASVSV